MLQITPQAEQHLIVLRVERGFGDKDGVRFLTNAGGVGLTFTAAPDPDDRVVEGTNLPIYVAPEAVAALEEATIDAKTEDGKTVLVIRRQRRPGAQDPSNRH
jgi:Fe-S cluster assembly iron-binding protein IscA